MQFCFGPRGRRLVNPFADDGGAEPALGVSQKAKSSARGSVSCNRSRGAAQPKPSGPVDAEEKAKSDRAKTEAVVTRRDYDLLQEKLTTTEEMLEDVLAEATED